MKASIIPASELSDDLTRLWESWQAADLAIGSPFLTHQFVRTYGNHTARARVAIIEDDHGPIGFLPFEARSFGLALGLGYGLVDAQSIIVKPGTSLALNSILPACGINLFEVDRFVPTQVETLQPCCSVHHAKPVIDLEQGWDAWLARKRETSRSRFKRIPQKRHKIERELGDITITFASRSHHDLDKLIAWKSAQYIRTGRPNRFGRRWFGRVLHDLLELEDQSFRPILTRLDAGGKTIALDFGLGYRTQLAGWFPTYDVALHRYSPGLICWLLRIEAAANAGYTSIDLGVGEAEYKESFKDRDEHAVEGWVRQQSMLASFHIAKRAPKRQLESIVLSRPALRKRAQATLNHLGKVRAKLHLP